MLPTTAQLGITCAVWRMFMGTEAKLTQAKNKSIACWQRCQMEYGSTFPMAHAGMTIIIAVATVAPRRLMTIATFGTTMAIKTSITKLSSVKNMRGSAGSVPNNCPESLRGLAGELPEASPARGRAWREGSTGESRGVVLGELLGEGKRNGLSGKK
mmetsp:Transcript_46363/g.85190  ORF Transcript_46363/g.85190 Transcript_46363/m.85190 type:complete len:156 (-) Transcript_46363:20-487(-)